MSLRARVVFVALLGVVSLTLFVQWSDIQVGGTMAAGPFPPLAACLQGGLLLAVQAAWAERKGAKLFTAQELLIILAVWLTANMVAGRGLLHPLLTSLVGPSYFARSGLVKTAISKDLPDWLAVTDRAAVSHFFEGYGVRVPWSVWWRPLATWALFFLPFLTANICLCALLERVWVRQERLAFPLVALPLEALRGGGARIHHPAGFRYAFGFGLAFPLLLHGFGVAHAYLPGIPCVPFYNDVSSIVTDPPWTAVQPLYVNLYPLLIGLTFLAPADVTLSIWFFLLMNKAEMLLTAANGWNEGTHNSAVATPPYIEEQSAGAFLALASVILWNSRAHLRQIVRAMGSGRTSATSNGSSSSLGGTTESSPEEYRAFRPLAAGFALGVIGMIVWCVVTGMPLWFSFGFFAFYFAVALVLGRLMAEGGIPWILAPVPPDKLFMSLTGSTVLSQPTLVRLTLHVQHLRDTRQMLAPAVFEAGKLRDEAGFPLRSFYGLLLAAVCLALVVGVASALPLFYWYGALIVAPISDGLMMSANVIPTTAISQLSGRLLTPVRPSPGAAAALMAGAGVAWGLSILRMRLLWWPLHPLGYALTGTLQLGYANKMVLSVFLGWAFKSLTLRFGGVAGFRMLRGAAIGLILGDLLMGGILKLLDALLGPSGYAIF